MYVITWQTPCYYTGGCPPFCRLGVSYTKLAPKPCSPITVRAFFFPLSEPFCCRPRCALGSYFLLMSIVTIWPLPAPLTLSFLLYYLCPLCPIHNEQHTLSEHPKPSSPYLSVSVVTSLTCTLPSPTVVLLNPHPKVWELLCLFPVLHHQNSVG